MELYLSRVCVTEKDDREQWIRFPQKTEAEYGLGRAVEHHVRLLSAHISRNHASLKKSSDGSFCIRDQNSLNGVHINDNKIKPMDWRTLKTGDKVEIGRPDDDEILSKLGTEDRFLYIVKEATSDELSEKLPGPKLHMDTATKQICRSKNKAKIIPKRTNIPLKRIPEKESCLKEKSVSKNVIQVKMECNAAVEKTAWEMQKESLPQDDEIEHENKRLKLELAKKEQALQEEICARKLKLGKELIQVKMEYEADAEKTLPQDNEMERENKRLKLELARKEKALQEEIDARKLKLEEEQKKLAAKLEENFKSKLVEKEEELEIRLQLEKDIAVEQVKADLEKDEKPSISMDTVVDTMENELQCSICSELFIVSTTLNCAHTFCEFCILQWKKVKSICPVCRNPIATMTRSLVLDNYIDKVIESLPGDRKQSRAKLIEERKRLMETSIKASSSGRGRGRRGRGRGRGRRGRSRGTGRGSTHFQFAVATNPIPPPPEPASIVVITDNESSSSETDLSDVDNSPFRYRSYNFRRYNADSDSLDDSFDSMY